MKKLQHIIHRTDQLSLPAGTIIATVLAVTFWFATVGYAQTLCTLCHKNALTINPVCFSSDYYRHIDHGDTMGACCVTPPCP